MTKEYSCPTCKASLGGQHCMTEKDATPKPGDVSVCVYCITPLMFTEDSLRLLTPEETDELSKDPLYVRVIFELQKRAAHR